MHAKRLESAILAALATASFGLTAHADAVAYGRSTAPAPLEGTWITAIQPVFCTTTPAGSAGDFVPGTVPVYLYLTFHRGGTLTESNSSAGFEPGQRGPGHGVWERTGHTSYQFAFQAFLQFDSTQPPFRYKRGYQRIEQTVEMHTNDEFTTSGPVRFFTGTSTTDPYIAGCARTSGVRMY